MVGLVSVTCAVGVAAVAALTTVDMAQVDIGWVMTALTAAASALAVGFTSMEA